MSYSVDWIGKIISIPTADLTLVSGTHYQLPLSEFLIEIRRLESGFAEGLWAPQIVEHGNTKFDFAGVDYAPFDEIINGYTIQFTGVATRVDLLGSNNNIIDVLIATGVSVVPSNSAGLQVYSTGSGLSVDQDTKLTNINSISAYQFKILDNKRILIKAGSTWYLRVFDDNGTTVIQDKALKDVAGNEITDIEAGALAQEYANSV